MGKKTGALDFALDRAIGFFSPRIAYERIRYRKAAGFVRDFEGAKSGRRTANWSTGTKEVNDLLKGGITVLRSRSRDLIRNNGWANNGVQNILPSMVVGAGIIPQADPAGGKRNANNADAAWIDWGDSPQCDVNGVLNFYGLQALALKTVAEAGSVLVRKIRLGNDHGLAIPLQLQVLEPDFLDTTRDTLGGLAKSQNGNRIVNGVEIDKNGRRVAYHLYKQHPYGSYGTWDSERIPASEILHIFRVDRPGQVDGIPWTAPSIIKFRDLDELEDAELVRAKIAACFTGVITLPEEIEDVDDDSDESEGLENIQPGAFETLGPGQDIRFPTPPQTDGAGAQAVRALRSIAASLGITYEALTGDFSGVNFSSARMGQLQMYANIERWRWQMLIPGLCGGVWGWFNEAGILAGRFNSPVRAKWTAPRREFIDPVKETTALRQQVRSGFISLSEAQRRHGNDPAEVRAEIADDYAELDKAGIKVDTDFRTDLSTKTTTSAPSDGGGDGTDSTDGDQAN